MERTKNLVFICVVHLFIESLLFIGLVDDPLDELDQVLVVGTGRVV